MKEYYNIPKEENLIILNMETKNDKSQKNGTNNNDDKSFNLGKNKKILGRIEANKRGKTMQKTVLN